MTATDASSTAGYTGLFEHGVDSSFRVMIPSAWRDQDKDAFFTMLPWPLGQPTHIVVLPPDRWAEAVRNLKAGASLTNTKKKNLQTAIASSAVRKQLDEAGRLCLGEKLAKQFQLTAGKAVLAGGIDRFEIWEPGRHAVHAQKIQEFTEEELEQAIV